MRDHHQVVALPCHRYQIVVGDQQVNDVVPHPGIRPEFGLSHPGDHVSGCDGSIALLDLGPLLLEHRDGFVGQPGDFLGGTLHGVGLDQFPVPGDYALVINDN